MEKLPSEIVISILEYCVVSHYADKNSLLDVRTVCKLFDQILRPFVLRTLQLEFTRLDKVSRRARPLDDGALRRIGHFCHALYLDMMVIRDDAEVRYLEQMFAKVPSMTPFVNNLRERYCMNEKSFTEVEYRGYLGYMLEHAPNVTAVRLNLPFQLISSPCYAATRILGNTLKAIAERPEETGPLKTLVLENLTDTTVVALWRNPQDVKIITRLFTDLEHLLISVRRYEEGHLHTINFRHRLWEMIGKCGRLKSLCLVNLDLEEQSFKPFKRSTPDDCTLEAWQYRSSPTVRQPEANILPQLTYLELRRVEILGGSLVGLLKSFAHSLRELYLKQVWLKAIYRADAHEANLSALWVGLPNVRPPANHKWVAVYLRQIRAQLRVCRVQDLGYDQYVIGAADETGSTAGSYDSEDPSGLGRTLEQRFVEVVDGIRQPDAADGSPVAYLPEEEAQTWVHADRARPDMFRRRDWDAARYAAVEQNPTSIWQKTIDCQFPNCNQFTLDELHRFADTACEGMNEINRAARREMLVHPGAEDAPGDRMEE